MVCICRIVFCSPITPSKLLVNICFQIPGIILLPVSATWCVVYIILVKEINLVNLFFILQKVFIKRLLGITKMHGMIYRNHR